MLLKANIEHNTYIEQKCADSAYVSSQILEGIDSYYALTNKSLKIESRTNGMAFNGDAYCVYTKGRDYCDIMELDPNLDCINETAFHELTHIMIYNDYEHFCGGYEYE